MYLVSMHASQSGGADLLNQQLTGGTNRMALNVTSPSAVKCVLARGSEESFEKRR